MTDVAQQAHTWGRELIALPLEERTERFDEYLRVMLDTYSQLDLCRTISTIFRMHQPQINHFKLKNWDEFQEVNGRFILELKDHSIINPFEDTKDGN